MINSMKQLVCLLLCGFLAGCDSRPKDDSVPVRGKVTNAGAPLKVNRPDVGLGYIELHFYRINDDGSFNTDPADAAVEPTGDFTVRGRDGHGLPPGKYKITVRQLDPAPDNDKLQGRFNLKNSRIVRDVTQDQEIIIDVSRPKGDLFSPSWRAGTGEDDGLAFDYGLTEIVAGAAGHTPPLSDADHHR